MLRASMLASTGMSSLLGATVLLNKQQQTDRHLASTHVLMGMNASDSGVFSQCVCVLYSGSLWVNCALFENSG